VLAEHVAHGIGGLARIHVVDLNNFLMLLERILTGSERLAGHCLRMLNTSLPPAAVEPDVTNALATVVAMADLASQTGSVVHVVVARRPGIVDHARTVAARAGLDVSIDLLPYSIRVRLSGAPAFVRP
jgi:hypothetical protein